MLLVVAEDLKHNRLALDVLDEGLGHLYRNLEGKRGKYGSYLKVFTIHENTALQAQPALSTNSSHDIPGCSVSVSTQGSL